MTEEQQAPTSSSHTHKVCERVKEDEEETHTHNTALPHPQAPTSSSHTHTVCERVKEDEEEQSEARVMTHEEWALGRGASES